MKKEKKIEKNLIRNIKLSRCYRIFLFFIMISIDCTLDISNGIISSASIEIKKHLKINNTEFGSFSTSVSIGKIISSFLFILLNQKISRKWLIIICLMLHSFFLFCFKITDNVNILIIIFGLLGFTKTIPTIYIPVWINQFGHSEHKTVQITSIQLFQSIGKIIGNLINLIFGYENWQNGFVISGCYLLFLSFCCLISNEDYFSRSLHPKKIEKEIETKNFENRISSTIFEDHNDNDNNNNNYKNEENNQEKKNYCSHFYLLLKNPLYIISLTCGSIIRGLISCLNYWYPDFLRNTLKEEQFKLTICYILVSLVGPFGGIIANWILKKYIGSYEGKKVSWPIVILHLISSFFAIGIGFMKSLFSVCIITICYLIFNSTYLALIQGIIISSVDKKLSATGFAFANACMQITTGTTPIIYGMINDKYKKKFPSFAMICIMSGNLLAVPLLILLAILRNKKFDEKDKNKENDIELIEK